MMCAEVRTLLPDHLKGEGLPPEARLHMDGCPACRLEFQELRALWQALGDLDQPRPGAGLEARILRRPRRTPYLLAAAALLLVAGGMALGRSLGPARPRGALALVASPSRGERLKGLALMSTGDGNLTGTLLALVDRDPDTQVRLAAVDSLFLAAGDPQLRPRLGTLLLRQERPEVQAALVDLIVGLRERQALEALRQLNRSGRLAPDLRRRLATGIVTLEAQSM